MNRLRSVRRVFVWGLVAAAMGGALTGCASARPDAANACVGPPGFCQPYFGS